MLGLRYDAFGQVSGTGGTAQADATYFQYAGAWGYEKEAQNGVSLHYLEQRYYDAAVGRFISRDPLKWVGGTNLYAYTENDPVNQVDPFGLAPTPAGSLPHPEPYVDTIESTIPDWVLIPFTGGGSTLVKVGGRGIIALLKGLFAGGARGVLTSTATKQGMAFLLARAGRGGVRFFKSFSDLKKGLGGAGNGNAWHHIVEKCNEGRFGREPIHNTQNVVKISWDLNNKIHGIYSSKIPIVTGSSKLTVRQWLSTKSYEEQFEFGMRVLDRLSQGLPFP